MWKFAKWIANGVKSLVQGVLALLPGTKDIVPEAKAELSRLGTQGSMELASALFNGHGFVPYGPGQYTPDVQHDQGQEQGHEHEMSRER
jgi:hypothetical protein